MKASEIANGQVIFVDANIFIDYFSANVATGPACRNFIQRVINSEISAVTSAHVLGEVAHRLLTIEACATFGWPYKGIAQRLADHPDEICKLSQFKLALEDISRFGIQVLSVNSKSVVTATSLMSQVGLLFNDALVATLMTENGVNAIFSSDGDFDRVKAITRYSPI